jgi:hypothetical protein
MYCRAFAPSDEANLRSLWLRTHVRPTIERLEAWRRTGDQAADASAWVVPHHGRLLAALYVSRYPERTLEVHVERSAAGFVGVLAAFDEWLHQASADFFRAVDAPGIETAGNHLAKSLGGESLDVSNRILGLAPPQDFAAAAHGGPLAPHEQSIEDRFPVRLDHKATVVCEILPETGWNRTSRRALKRRRHKKHEHLEFRVTDTTLPEPYEVYWKVRNYGREAWLRGQLRGQIKHGQRTHRESTLYRGEHYVDCYLGKDGVCRARTRVWVPIS